MTIHFQVMYRIFHDKEGSSDLNFELSQEEKKPHISFKTAPCHPPPFFIITKPKKRDKHISFFCKSYLKQISLYTVEPC